jgi:AcrR family transcriptional regulator
MSEDLPVRERLLDAAVEVATLNGLAKLSVGDVARNAGLSRQTLYKHFSSREELVAAAVLREAAAIVGEIIAVTEPIDDPRESLDAAILVTLRLTREHPLLDRLVRTEPEALLPVLVADTSPVSGAIREVVEHIIDRKLPGLSALHLRRSADMLTRLLISYAVSAPDDPPDVVASFIATAMIEGLASIRTRH